MTQHKYAELLRYAAENADANFQSASLDKLYVRKVYKGMYSIEMVLKYPDLNDWKIYKEPVTEVVWYWKDKNERFVPFTAPPDLETWIMKITYIDGKPTKAEFSE